MSAVTPSPGPPVERSLLSSFERAGLSPAPPAPTPDPVPVPPPIPPTPPAPLDLDRVRLVDSVPGVFDRLAHKIKELARRFFAWIQKAPYEPDPIKEPKPLEELNKIPRAMLTKLTRVKAALPKPMVDEHLNVKNAEWCSWFAPEHFTEIFRTMGHDDVARGARLFDEEPAAILLYLYEVQWRAAYWGSIERGVNWLKNKFIRLDPRDFDPKHAEISTELFCNAMKEKRVANVWDLIKQVRCVRIGMKPEEIRSAYEASGLTGAEKLRLAFDPFTALVTGSFPSDAFLTH